PAANRTPRLLEPDVSEAGKLDGPLQCGKRRVPFIEVQNVDLEAQCGEHPPSAHPEDNLLEQPAFRLVDVQFTRGTSIARAVKRMIGIEQIETAPPDVRAPDPDQHGSPR